MLCLIPTPLYDPLPLEPVALDKLKTAPEDALIIVEDVKIARRRWLQWGLPREKIDSFIPLHEQNEEKTAHQILAHLKEKKAAFLMSDTGLPAFCDPGRQLVDLCHRNHVPVTSTPFPHSVALAVALSGMNCEPYYFQGFLPQKTEARTETLRNHAKRSEAVVLMDTPYRFKKTLEEISQQPGTVFVALNLNHPDQKLFRAPTREILSRLHLEMGNANLKCEFVMIWKPNE